MVSSAPRVQDGITHAQRDYAMITFECPCSSPEGCWDTQRVTTLAASVFHFNTRDRRVHLAEENQKSHGKTLSLFEMWQHA